MNYEQWKATPEGQDAYAQCLCNHALKRAFEAGQRSKEPIVESQEEEEERFTS